MVRYPFQVLSASTFTLTLGLTIAGPVSAQVIPDRTLPVNSSVTAGCVICEINGGTTRGTNLFHSFSNFSIPTNGSASFNNSPQIQTIFTRVTGSQISNIDGLLQTKGSASLFLMNPNGIVFGPSASLNLGGSFVGTTANAIGFGQSETFSAVNPDAPPLLTIDPSALIFNSASTGRIVNRSVTPLVNVPDAIELYGLQVDIGKSIGLIGGDVLIDSGGISAPGGRIELGGLAAPGTIGLRLQSNDLQLQFPAEVLKSTVSLTNKALVSVPFTGGGSVYINARNLEMSGGSTIRGGIELGLISDRPSGDIVFNVSEGIRLVDSGTEINNNIRPNSVGDAGSIILNTGSLLVSDKAILRSVTFGKGNSGPIEINARDTIVFDKSYLLMGSLLEGVGNSGIAKINTGSLSLRNGSAFDTGSVGKGNGGTISIQATGAVDLSGSLGNRSYIFSGIDKNGIGTGGNIRITAESLSLKNGLIQADIVGSQGGGIPGRGRAGNIILNIRSNILIDSFGSGIFSSLGFTAVGNAGKIRLNSGSLTMDRGAIATNSFGIGNAGDIDINIENNIVLSDQSSIVSSVITPVGFVTAIGNSGEIRILSKSIKLNDNSFIDTAINGQGDAGNLFINVNTLQLNNSSIGASPSKGGKAGTIRINARDNVTLQGKDSIISSVLFSGEGRGGDITIDTQDLSIIDSLGGISSYIRGDGNAGDINLNVGNRLLIKNSLVLSALIPRLLNSSNSKGGEININTGSFFLTDGGQLIASTFGKGKSGNITINAKEFVSIAGDKPSSISVESTSNGFAGDLLIKTPRLTIADRSSLSAGSNAANGGNINLILGELLLLRRGGNIRTNAGTPTTTGNGGNIDITMLNGLIAAVLSEDSDISANAYSGKGGKINITAQGIYGIQFQPQLTAFSDITASSTLGLSGEVNLTTPNVDPSRSLVQLPVGLVDPTNKIDRRCSPKAPQRSSSFTITGTGGIPASPIEALQQQNALVNLVPLPKEDPTTEQRAQSPMSVSSRTIAEAQGWSIDDTGGIWLVASDERSQRSPIASFNCSETALMLGDQS
jgi:filamentous hemagglutinin family protein